jgi:hypothetical protein
MDKRKKLLIVILTCLFTAVNIYFLDLKNPFLLYTSIVNGAILGAITGHLIDNFLKKKVFLEKFIYMGLILGMLFTVLEINNQISVEFYINKDKLYLMPPYIDYFRFYLIGLFFGVAKSFYFFVAPLTIIFASIGFLLDKIKKKN